MGDACAGDRSRSRRSTRRGCELPDEAREHLGDLRLARDYALALAHYAFWRHPPGTLRWLSTGAVAALALGDLRNYAWLLVNIGRHLFFISRVEEAVDWLNRGARILDRGDQLDELAYAYTDLGTSWRILDQPRQALAYFRAAFACVAQLGDQYGVATTHMNLGSAFYGMQDFDEALREYQQALRISMRMNNVQQMAQRVQQHGVGDGGHGPARRGEECLSARPGQFPAYRRRDGHQHMLQQPGFGLLCPGRFRGGA